MKDSLKRKLYELAARHEEIAHLLGTPAIINDQEKFRRLNQEYSQLTPVAEGYLAWQKTSDELAELLEWRDGSDPELRAMAQDEWEASARALAEIETHLQTHLVPRDPLDDSNIFLEIRAAAGGDESAIFAGDLFRMYSKYAETCGWQIEILNTNIGEHGGYKEIISRIEGFGAYSRLKFESGAHRVQRVPETESQGRVHTSTCTVAVLPELAEVEKIDINPADLKVDTFRASGAGGQHVNKTDSAIRITHLPSGMVVECQEERSQHKNRARAMSLLASRLLEIEQRKQNSEISENRRKLVGTGDRSERIRTYNYAQGRVSDHRINLTLYKLPAVLEGDLDDVINPLLAEDQAERLAALGE